MEPYYNEVRRYLAGGEEMEPIVELHRSLTDSLDAVFRVWSTNHESAAHQTWLKFGGREFINGQRHFDVVANKDCGLLEKWQM